MRIVNDILFTNIFKAGKGNSVKMKKKPLTIADVKYLNKQKGGHFF